MKCYVGSDEVVPESHQISPRSLNCPGSSNKAFLKTQFSYVNEHNLVFNGKFTFALQDSVSPRNVTLPRLLSLGIVNTNKSLTQLQRDAPLLWPD